MSAAKHFYITFNPYLNTEHEHEYTQAHEFYDQLKELKLKKKTATMHWGKMIGADRTSNLNTAGFQSIITENLETNCSTHLYITDFQNLWVAKVDSIKDTISKKDKTLSFYEGKNVEIWFEITDMTLLEHNHEDLQGHPPQSWARIVSGELLTWTTIRRNRKTSSATSTRSAGHKQNKKLYLLDHEHEEAGG